MKNSSSEPSAPADLETKAARALAQGPGLEKLAELIDNFNRTGKELETRYAKLEEKLRRMEGELQEKNRQIASIDEERRSTLSFLNHLLDTMPTGLLVMGRDGKIESFNQAAARMLGPDMAKGNGAVEAAAQLIKKRVFESAGPAEAGVKEITYRRDSAPTRRLSFSWSTLNRSGLGNKGALILVTDVTEARKLQEKIERDRRLAAIGEMSARIAHEIRNPLGSLTLFLSIIEAECKDMERCQKPLKYLASSVENMDRLITELLDFSKPMEPEIETVKLVEAVSDCLAMVARAAEIKNVKIEATSDENLEVKADSILLKRALLNLILNALDIVGKDGKIKILARKTGFDKVAISVIDNGPGMSAEVKKDIFEPFYTTRQQGTGLGLSIVRRIAEAHEGSVRVHSLPGAGAAFSLIIPR